MSTTRRSFLARALAGAGAVLTRSLPAGARPKYHKHKKHGALFIDDFKRHDRKSWGGRWFNQRYRRNWSIDDHRALYRLPPTENDLYYRPNPVLVLDHDVETVDVRATVSMSNPTGRVGAVLRAVGYDKYYAVYIGPGGVLRVTRCDHHDEALLGRKEFGLKADQRYRIRARISGTNPVLIKAKVWPVTGFEPLRWGVEAVDASTAALTGAAPFGVFTEHAIDARSVVLRVLEFAAYSKERPKPTSPSIAYSLVGPPFAGRIRAVAKTSVPATIHFQYGTDPAFATGHTVRAGRTGRAQTARATLSLGDIPPSTTVYWRAIAQRRGATVYGPTSSFRTGPDPDARLPVRFAFGCCTKWQKSPRHSFEQARLKKADFYLHQGDLGYAPHRVTDHDADTYQDHWVRMLLDPYLLGMVKEMPFAFYQDDADYGSNNATKNTLRPFTIRAWDDLHANPPGAYFSFAYGDIHFFVLDCRRYSSGKKVPDDKRYKIGDVQKKWLFESMKEAAEGNAGLLVVASPQTFGSDASPGSWRRGYDKEWAEVIEFFEKLPAPVLIVSGDSHGHRLYEYPQKVDPSTPRIVEFLSAGTEQNKFSTDIDASFIVREARKVSGFGMVEIGAEQEIAGQHTRTLTLTAINSADGTPLWRPATYLIVRGVGIFPTSV